jgi:hypothetical protein
MRRMHPVKNTNTSYLRKIGVAECVGTKRMFQFLRGDLTDDSRHLIACDVHGGADSGSPAAAARLPSWERG